MALIELGRLDEARERLDAAEGWVRETGNREQLADHAAAVGEWHLARGDASAARRAFSQAAELAATSGSPAAVLRAQVARAAALLALGDTAAAQTALATASRRADALGDVLLRARAFEVLGRAELARGRLPAADDSVGRAIDVAQAVGWNAGLWRLQALRGRIRERRSDLAGADEAFAASALGIARLREGLTAELRSSFDGVTAVREVEERAASRQTAAR